MSRRGTLHPSHEIYDYDLVGMVEQLACKNCGAELDEPGDTLRLATACQTRDGVTPLTPRERMKKYVEDAPDAALVWLIDMIQLEKP